jgi:hypothetical protein
MYIQLYSIVLSCISYRFTVTTRRYSWTDKGWTFNCHRWWCFKAESIHFDAKPSILCPWLASWFYCFPFIYNDWRFYIVTVGPDVKYRIKPQSLYTSYVYTLYVIYKLDNLINNNYIHRVLVQDFVLRIACCVTLWWASSNNRWGLKQSILPAIKQITIVELKLTNFKVFLKRLHL